MSLLYFHKGTMLKPILPVTTILLFLKNKDRGYTQWYLWGPDGVALKSGSAGMARAGAGDALWVRNCQDETHSHTQARQACALKPQISLPSSPIFLQQQSCVRTRFLNSFGKWSLNLTNITT